MSDRDSDFGAFLTGFFIGSMVGAIVALLYAPQSGEETRTAIKEKSIEIKDKAVVTAEEARGKAEKALEDARKRADLAIAETRARAEELAQLTKQRAIELQQRGSEVIEAGKKAAKKTTDKGEATPA